MKPSLFNRIHLIFTFCIILLVVVFSLILYIDSHHKEMEIHRRLSHAIKIMNTLDDENLVNERLALLDLKHINQLPYFDKPYSEEILKMGPLHFKSYDTPTGKYWKINSFRGEIIFLDTAKKSLLLGILIPLFFIIFSIFLILYRSIIQGLNPLKMLTSQLSHNGTIPTIVLHSREMEELFAAFSEREKKLSTFNEARQLLLRNIAHELKTPLTKGRLIIEMSNDEVIKEKLQILFIRFDMIIDELLQIEKISMEQPIITKKVYSLSDVIEHALELLFIEDDHICEFPQIDVFVVTDYKLLTLLFKNLFDNAIKFSNNRRFDLLWVNNTLTISNDGESLNRPFELLSEAFVKGDDSSSGLGLGLYIVSQISRVLNLPVEYEYVANKHHFKLFFENLIASE